MARQPDVRLVARELVQAHAAQVAVPLQLHPLQPARQCGVARQQHQAPTAARPELAVDLEAMKASYPGVEIAISLPPGPRNQLLEGTWDATRILLAAKDETAATAKRLPYVSNFARR